MRLDRAGIYAVVPWSRAFDDPIPMPDGLMLRTLRQAADHIQRLPAREVATGHWQLALHCLIEAAESREPVMQARIAVLRALNHGRPAPAAPPRNRAKAYRILR